MELLADRITAHWLQNGIIAPEDAEWCHYSLMRRMLTLPTGFVLLLLGSLVADWPCSILFTMCLLFLRARTNGYHAKSCLECFVFSCLIEVLCLSLLPVLEPSALLVIGIFAIAIIWWLAPVNNPDIHFSASELRSTRIRARFRLAVSAFSALILYSFLPRWSGCIVLAMAATAILLVVSKNITKR